MKKTQRYTKTIFHKDTNGIQKEYSVTFLYEDIGIGAYEYWGAKGNHVDWHAGVVSVEESGKDVTEEIPKELVLKWENEETEERLADK